MADFYWKRHDTAPSIQATLSDSDGNPVDLTGAAVKFIMIAAGANVPKVNAAGTITDAASGSVSYTPVSADTDTAGDYQAEWQVTFAGGAKQTFPDPDYLDVLITPDLDNA